MPAEVVEEQIARAAPPPADPPVAVEAPSPDVSPLPATRFPAPQCANCLTPLDGPFCSQCGQHVADYHRSVWRFVADFFDNAFCWDNKLFRTLGPLIKRPGLLTQEFMAGRRVRYVHPLRLFLFTSAICLALLQFNHRFDKSNSRAGKNPKPGINVGLGTDADARDARQPAKPAASLPPTTPPPSASPANAVPEQSDSLGQILRDTFKAGVTDQKAKDPKADEELSRRWETLGNVIEQRANAANGLKTVNEKIATNIQQKASWVALAMLPIFAWLMRFAYGRQGGYFFNYLVFSLHYHTFLLLFWTAYLWLGTLVKAVPFASLGVLLLPLLLAPPWYLYMALRRFYGESPVHTAAKTFAIGGLHLLAIFIGVGWANIGSFL